MKRYLLALLALVSIATSMYAFEIVVDNSQSKKVSKVELEFDYGAQEIKATLQPGQIKRFNNPKVNCVSNFEVSQRKKGRYYEIERCQKLCGRKTIEISSDNSAAEGFRVQVKGRWFNW